MVGRACVGRAWLADNDITNTYILCWLWLNIGILMCHQFQDKQNHSNNLVWLTGHLEGKR